MPSWCVLWSSMHCMGHEWAMGIQRAIHFHWESTPCLSPRFSSLRAASIHFPWRILDAYFDMYIVSSMYIVIYCPYYASCHAYSSYIHIFPYSNRSAPALSFWLTPNFRQWQADPSAVEPPTAYKNADTVFQVAGPAGLPKNNGVLNHQNNIWRDKMG